MKSDDRIARLERMRRELKAKVAEESRRPHPDALSLMRLKKEKVRIKDEIAALRGRADIPSAA